MSVDVGSAIGYLDIDISGFLSGLENAMSQTQAAQNRFEAIGGKISGVGDKISSVGTKLTGTVTAPLLALGTAGMKVATDFETAMSEVRAITGTSGEEFSDQFEAMRNEALELGASTAFSAVEVANAMTEMAKAGWNSEQIIAGMSGVLDAAAASGEGLAAVSTIVADAITGFGLEAADSSRVADLLTQAANSGTIGIHELGESFKYIAPVAQSMGFSIEDVTTAISAMSMAGIKGSQAGTSLRTMITNLVKPTDQIVVAMEELGIEVTNSDGTLRSLDDIIGTLRDSFDGLSDEQKAYYAATLAGKEGMSGLLSLLNLTEEQYNDIAASMDAAKGTAQETADVMQDNLQAKIEQLGGSLESLAIILADHVIPHVQNFVEWLTGLVEKFAALDPATQETILTIAGIAAVVGPVTLVIGKLTSGVGSLVTGIGKVTSLFGKFTSAASTVPAPAEAAGKGVGSLAKSALNLLAAGAGILMAAGGLALLATAAIQLSEAGWPAIAVMGGLVVALAGLAVGAAAIAPALTAGAAGLIAFGAAIALVGVGILAATSGVALLATQLPTISEYGSQAAVAIVELGGALISFGGGALAAGAGCLSLAGGLTTVGLGSAAAAVGIGALSLGVIALGAGVITLGAGLTLCGAGMTLMAATAETATAGLVGFTSAAGAAFVPITAGAAACAALDLAIVALLIPLAALTVELAASAVSCGLLSVAMASTASSVASIEASATSASDSLKSMIASVDKVEASLNGLKSVAGDAASSVADELSRSSSSVQSAASSLARGVTNGITRGLSPLPSKVDEIMDRMDDSVSDGMSDINTTIRSGFRQAATYIRSLSAQAYTWGADIIQGMARGINANIRGPLTAAINNAANAIRSRLHFSVPDEGPLTDYESWMPDFMHGLANGINKNAYLVGDAAEGVAERMQIKPEYSTEGLFGSADSEGLKSYNMVLINTLGIYRQLVEQMRLCSEYSSGIAPMSNGLLDVRPTTTDPQVQPVYTNTRETDSGRKPDVLNINLQVGEDTIETVVVDLLRREVRT